MVRNLGVLDIPTRIVGNLRVKFNYGKICDVKFDQRPNLTSQGGLKDVETMLEKRNPIYESCADCQIDTEGKSPREIVDEIIHTLDLTS